MCWWYEMIIKMPKFQYYPCLKGNYNNNKTKAYPERIPPQNGWKAFYLFSVCVF